MTALVTALLAGLLTVGTVIGVTQSINNSTADRVPSSSNAPVYGTP